MCVMPQLSEFVRDELDKEAATTEGKVKAHQLHAEVNKLAKGTGKSRQKCTCSSLLCRHDTTARHIPAGAASGLEMRA